MTTSTETITARLFAGLETQTAARRSPHSLLLTETLTVGAVGARLGLKAGDEISLFPPLGGG